MFLAFILYIDISISYLAQFMKTRMEYKFDFLIGLVSTLLFQVITLMFIDVLFAEQALTLNGWTKAQVFFIYGFNILPLTLFSAFCTNLYMVAGTYIIEGEFDRILLRPLDSLYQVLLEKVNVERLFGLFLGLAVMYFASRQMELSWNLLNIVLVPVFTVCGFLIYAGVFTVLAALSFWWPDRMGLIPPVYNLIAFGKYPVTIYNPLLQFLLMWIIPFAFAAFFPSTWFIGRSEEFRYYVWLSPGIAIATAGIAYFVWRLGVRRYESTGS